MTRYRPDCTGASSCPAVQHIHGCYADFGSCDNPGEHWINRATPSKGSVPVSEAEGCEKAGSVGGEQS